MTIVKTILAQMPAVRQPQAKFLDTLFATILALRGHVNFHNLSRYCDYSERTLQRQFRASFDGAQFHLLTLQHVWGEADEWIEVQDASFVPKSGKPTPGLGSFFNGCAGRPERGLEISVLALVNVTRGYGVTRHVVQTPAGTKAAGDESRLVWSAQQVREQRATLPPQVRYLVVDGAYAKRPYLDAVVSDTRHIITKLRRDADCSFLHTAPRQPGQKGRPRKYDGKVNWQDVARFTCLGTLPDEPHVTMYTAVVWHHSLGWRMRLVVLVNRQEPHKPRSVVLGTTDVELDALTVVRYYRARFQIEFLFRDGKQFTGLSDCQARDARALDFHFNAALATLNLVRVSEVQAAATAPLKVFSLASWKQRQFNERLVETLITKLDLEPTLIKHHPRYEEIRTYGALAA